MNEKEGSERKTLKKTELALTRINETMSSTNHQSHARELHFLMDTLSIPFLKVNRHYYPLKWNSSFIHTANAIESDFHLHSIKEMSLQNPLMSRCLHLIKRAISTNEQKESAFEDDKSLLYIRAVPFWEDKSVYIFIEDRSLQRQFDQLLTFHDQIKVTSHIAAGVAHEIRNPLSVIKGFLQLSKLTGDFHKYYDTIMSELNRMNQIVEDFLSVSRKKDTRTYESPVTIMNSLMDIIKAECTLNNVTLHVQLKETDKLIYVNESTIKQVILNILRNAIEAFRETNKKNTFEISSAIEGNNYTISMRDNGKGISADVLKRIDEPFFTTKETGTGVGIPLCKKIIEEQGGSFHIESTYDIGTTVIISLPFVERD